MSDYIFVYGTLKRGGVNERLMDGTHYVADGMIRCAALLNMPGFPGLLLGKCPEDMYAKGEVYKIDGAEDFGVSAEERDRVLATLDFLEQEGRIYKRVILPVVPTVPGPLLDVSGNINCWTYVLLMDLPPSRLVRDGNWEMGDDIQCLK